MSHEANKTQQKTQQQAEEIFIDAIELDPAQRAEFITAQCGEDSRLRSLVESLIAADEAAGGGNFLASQFLDGADIDQVDEPTEPGAAEEDSTRFKIVTRHEQGGLGEVLIAHDRQLNRHVAVKQIRAKWLEHNEARERFTQEAEITGRLEHPGVVPVYAMGTWDDGKPFYAMRFIRGDTLKEVIAKNHALEDKREFMLQLRGMLNRFVDVCNTVEYAHSKRILHRDIKPANIMVGPYGETLVVDWGLAKLLDAPPNESLTLEYLSHTSSLSDSSRTELGRAVGTPQYMSPEQATGDVQSVSVVTDVYLLGATLYQILTGQPPHQEESVQKIIDRITNGELIAPREINANVPRALQAVCLKAMSVEPYLRYQSAADLAADVERWSADEPVSVHSDTPAVRLGRWYRHHRALAMTGLVSSVLLTLGLIAGILFWSYQQSRELQVEQDRRIQELQLANSKKQRLNGLQESAEAALALSEREIQANRFSAATNVLTNAANAVANEPSLHQQHQMLTTKRDRINSIVQFYQHAEESEQFNVMSRDTQGMLACKKGLQAIGVWESPDWWTHLPDQDLSPAQKDRFRWDVYQQWLMLDGMLIKTVGSRLFGGSQSGSAIRPLAILRKLNSSAGVREAESALIVSQRIDWFRQSEATKWYRSIGNFRLGKGKRLSGGDLETPKNASDAQKVGVLCLIAAMDPSFRIAFDGYKGQDSVTAARDLFQRSASLRPNHYWTQLALGQMQYFTAKMVDEPSWQSFQPAIQTMGRCIALKPESCFAFADRSSLFRFQSDAMRRDESLDPAERDQRIRELLRWSLRDAQVAFRSFDEQPWVGWPYGLALFAAGQQDEAIGVFIEASKRTFPLMQIGDSTLVSADDIRGRSTAAETARELTKQHPDDPLFHTLLASILANQGKFDESLVELDRAFRGGDVPAHGFAVRGMMHLRTARISEAAEDFRIAIQRDPTSVWAVFGVGACDEANGEYDSAVRNYTQAKKIATTGEHRAACDLALSRAAAFVGDFKMAKAAIGSALQVQPASDVVSVVKPLLERFKQLRRESRGDESHVPLGEFLKSLGEHIAVGRIEFENDAKVENFLAAILNGDFEFDSQHYWSDETGASWRNESGYTGLAEISTAERHAGTSSLHIVGRPIIDDSQRGSTSQAFDVPQNCSCRLSVWAKSIDLQAGAVTVEIDGLTNFTLDPGTYDWREFSSEFEVGKAPDPFLETVPLRIKLISQGGGEVFLDDIQLQVTLNP